MTIKQKIIRNKYIKELKELGFLVDRRPGHSGWFYKTKKHFHLIAWIDENNLEGLLRICKDPECNDGIIVDFFDDLDLNFNEMNFNKFISSTKKCIKILDTLNQSIVSLKKYINNFNKLKNKYEK